MIKETGKMRSVMTESTAKNRWGVEQRLEFIEFVLYWDGEINRSRIIDQFSVSGQQASNDLTRYQAIAPQNIRYDLSSKRYVPTEEFRCQFLKPDAEKYLGQLHALSSGVIRKEDTWLDTDTAADSLPIPTRAVDPEILRTILRAIRSGKSIEIHYQSFNNATPEPVWRRITPHAFASDGLRWHVRAFCHRSGIFKDFLLSRCRGTRDEQAAQAKQSEDTEWLNYFEVKLTPNPRLNPWERKAIELDYDMHNGEVTLQIRLALLYYFDKRFGAEFEARTPLDFTQDPKRTPVVISNRDEYLQAMGSVNSW
ncbi:WYL domain-containing protein [Paraburkholderia phenazinium]|uniref:WYL domain-containing protein n=1 Tax=Paraburkholderia phenazinium TaxID=60549 RepID=UPI001ABB3777|nr:WYL domain-containing protein [Paraburkholderia phenazinium]